MCSWADPTALQLTRLTPAPALRASTATVPYVLLSHFTCHFHMQVLDWRCLTTCLPCGCKGGCENAFSSFYLAKPHLTQERYLKGAVRAENRTGPRCGGHTAPGSIPVEWKTGPSFCPLYLRQTPVTLSAKLHSPVGGGEQSKGGAVSLPSPAATNANTWHVEDLSEHGRPEGEKGGIVPALKPDPHVSPAPGPAVRSLLGARPWADPRCQGEVGWACT